MRVAGQVRDFHEPGTMGRGPSGRPGRGSRSQPPDLEEVIRKGQERLEQIFRGGGGSGRGFSRGHG